MGFVVGVVGAFILFCGFAADNVQPADRPVQFAALAIGTVLILAGLIAHYKWGGGDE